MTGAARMLKSERVLASAIAALVLSLLLIGLISGTFLRHVVQVVPALLAGALLRYRPGWSRAAAIPIFAFWLFIMILIWTYLFGLTKAISGRFTTAEIVLTIVMAIASVAGLVESRRPAQQVGWLKALLAMLLFAGIQLGFMLLSFTRQIADR